MDYQTLFLTVNGRIGKKDYWVGVGCLFLAGMVLSNVPYIRNIWPLASMYFAVCIYGKRLHDIGQSAWMVLVPTGIMLIAFALSMILGGGALIAAMGQSSDSVNGVASIAALGLLGLILLLGMLACLAWIVWLGTRDSEPTENKFGPPRTVPLVTAF